MALPLQISPSLSPCVSFTLKGFPMLTTEHTSALISEMKRLHNCLHVVETMTRRRYTPGRDKIAQDLVDGLHGSDSRTDDLCLEAGVKIGDLRFQVIQEAEGRLEKWRAPLTA